MISKTSAFKRVELSADPHLLQPSAFSTKSLWSDRRICLFLAFQFSSVVTIVKFQLFLQKCRCFVYFTTFHSTITRPQISRFSLKRWDVCFFVIFLTYVIIHHSRLNKPKQMCEEKTIWLPWCTVLEDEWITGALHVRRKPPTCNHFRALLVPHKEYELYPQDNWQAQKAEPGNEMALTAHCQCLRYKTPSQEIFYISIPSDTCSALAQATRLKVINASG